MRANKGSGINGNLVGAVGIENNADRNFKDLEEMLGSAKELKRNNRECKGILIGPFPALREASDQVKFRDTDGKLTRPVTYLDGCEGPICTEFTTTLDTFS